MCRMKRGNLGFLQQSGVRSVRWQVASQLSSTPAERTDPLKQDHDRVQIGHRQEKGEDEVEVEVDGEVFANTETAVQRGD